LKEIGESGELRTYPLLLAHSSQYATSGGTGLPQIAHLSIAPSGVEEDVTGRSLLTNDCVDASFALLRSGRRIRISPDSAIRNEAAAKIEVSSLNTSIDRITRISPIVGVVLLTIGITTSI